MRLCKQRLSLSTCAHLLRLKSHVGWKDKLLVRCYCPVNMISRPIVEIQGKSMGQKDIRCQAFLAKPRVPFRGQCRSSHRLIRILSNLLPQTTAEKDFICICVTWTIIYDRQFSAFIYFVRGVLMAYHHLLNAGPFGAPPQPKKRLCSTRLLTIARDPCPSQLAAPSWHAPLQHGPYCR